MSAKPRFYDSLLSGLFGDSKRPEAERPDLAVPMLANWLPYRSYDPKTGIFYNSDSRGFVIEVSPLVGADERTGEILTQFLSEGIPVPGCLQFHDWMSPRISERLSKWYLPRYSASGVYERMEQAKVFYQTADQETASQWRQQIAATRAKFAQRDVKLSNKLQVTMQIINRSIMLESTLQNTMTPGMSSALNFSRGLNAHGLL